MMFLPCALLLVTSVAAAPPVNLRAAIDAWVQNNQQALVSTLAELLAIPNAAADRENIRRNAVWLREHLAKRGFAAESWRPPAIRSSSAS